MQNLRSIRNDIQAAPSRADYVAAQRAAAEAEYRAAVNALAAEYAAARAAGDDERAQAIKAQGQAMVNARYGL